MNRRSGIIAGPIGNDYFKKNKDDSSQNTRSHPYITNPNIRVPGQIQPQINVPKHMEPQVIRLSAEDINKRVTNLLNGVGGISISTRDTFTETPISVAADGLLNYSIAGIIGLMAKKSFWVTSGSFIISDVFVTAILNTPIYKRNNMFENILQKIDTGEAQGLEMIITPNITSSPYPAANIDFRTY